MYQITTEGVIYRTTDGAWIPPDPGNRDYQEYLRWVSGGGMAAKIDNARPT